MKVFATLPKQFTRKGMTFVKSRYTLEGVIRANIKYRLVLCKSTGKVYVYTQVED